ncbi:MAG: EAL domain-containing protein [Gammaproteobacteria bacterium]|nr:EAL domain-containing protein [Gammaproteobacteria bacterium]
MNQRIMIIEDERIAALDLKLSLESLGYDVVGIASEATAAVEEVARLRPDLVLMDIHLDGGSDGTVAATAIRERWRLPVVFLTAYADEATLARAEPSLPYGYLVKPFQLRELSATVRMALARHDVERRLTYTEERLRLAIDAAALGVFEYDEGSDSVVVDGRTEWLTGHDRPGQAVAREVFWGRLAEADRVAVEREIGAGQPVSRTVRMRFANCETGWADLLARLYDAPEDGTRLVGVLRDVTERELADEKLRQAQVVFDSSVQGLLVLDAAGHIVAANPAFTRMTGYDRDAVLGRDPDDFLVTRRRHDHDENGDAPPDPGHWQGEAAYLRADGQIFLAWQQHCVVRDAAGAITHYVLILNDFSTLRRMQGELNFLAYHDALTGLGNRRMLDERLATEIETARRAECRLALLFVDLDGFKLINDTLGHAHGDTALKAIGERLGRCLRPTDVLARFGGDEFIVLLPHVDAITTVDAMADCALREIRRPLCVGVQEFSVSASIGIALFPEHGDDASTLIKAGDSAMHEAKLSGRNCALHFHPYMAERVRERLNIEQGLRRALERDLLEVRFQPIVRLDDGRLASVEVLLRWNDAELGTIPPNRFIPVAEEGALINMLGEWVLRAACAQIAAWRAQGLTPPPVAVNVSARQLGERDFVRRVQALIAEYAIRDGELTIEITESVLQHLDASRQTLLALRALGVRVAIDDFGAGFSALGLLKHLPIDALKIDRSLIADLPDSASDVAIVGAIVSMARSLGVSVTAEGIETERQRDLLQSMACDYGQGWLFGKADVADLVASGLETMRPAN